MCCRPYPSDTEWSDYSLQKSNIPLAIIVRFFGHGSHSRSRMSLSEDSSECRPLHGAELLDDDGAGRWPDASGMRNVCGGECTGWQSNALGTERPSNEF
jgi:hypothetical protein